MASKKTKPARSAKQAAQDSPTATPIDGIVARLARLQHDLDTVTARVASLEYRSMPPVPEKAPWWCFWR